jgi:hypothetical protein
MDVQRYILDHTTTRATTSPRIHLRGRLNARSVGNALLGGTSENSKFVIASVLRHSKLHRSSRPFSCVYCEKTFVRGDALTRHLRSRPPNCRRIEETVDYYGSSTGTVETTATVDYSAI